MHIEANTPIPLSIVPVKVADEHATSLTAMLSDLCYELVVEPV